MGKGIFVIGTNTDIGKTFVSGAITYKLKKHNKNVIPYKPIQSGGIEENIKIIPPDIKYIRDICDLDIDYNTMNTYCLKTEVSPHLACNIENVYINKENIINHYNKLLKIYDYVVAEGAGGIVVPITNDYFLYDLIKDLNMDVVIVASASVGTINHSVLTYEFLKSKNIKCRGIFINNYKKKFYEDDNIKMIREITKLDVVGILNKIDNFTKENIKKEYDKLDLDNIISLFE
ncbi:dethiobiotin synthase [Romboutsia sp. 1001713B170131_170501_G6]|uniref:dethiobiotin synthase n=1 Tax=Romboutsia sp. 1001713B170131_170501_G6 TaxID=2787108 RepID=UPI0018AC8D23|nr:dethiobiotin synthase [Romboutsia sp. 1001713B170131_170501_G6]